MYQKSLTTIVFCTAFVCQVLAQKDAVKSITHQRNTLNNKGVLALSLQIKQDFNKFNRIALQEYSYPDKKGKLQLDRQVRYSYDAKGRHQNTLEYNGDGILTHETKLSWDEQDNKNKVEEITYTNGKQTSVAVTYQLEYDGEGNKEAEHYFNENGDEIKGRTWTYNNQKEVSKSVMWIDNKKEPRKEIYTTYQRDNNGDLVKSVAKEKVNGKIFRKDIRYFNNNYVVEWKTYINGRLESEFLNEYRDSVIIRTTRHNKREIISIEEDNKRKEKLAKNKDKRSKKDRRKSKDNIWVTNTEYDGYGNILVTSQSINDVVVFVTQYAYDDYGNKIKTIKYNKEKDEKEEERLAYDDNGNIAKRTVLKDDKVQSEDVYQYEYFEQN